MSPRRAPRVDVGTAAGLFAAIATAPTVRPWHGIPREAREAFAARYALATWRGCPNGNPRSVVVGFPNASMLVPMYDIDGGGEWMAPLRSLTAAKRTAITAAQASEWLTGYEDLADTAGAFDELAGLVADLAEEA